MLVKELLDETARLDKAVFDELPMFANEVLELFATLVKAVVALPAILTNHELALAAIEA